MVYAPKVPRTSNRRHPRPARSHHQLVLFLPHLQDLFVASWGWCHAHSPIGAVQFKSQLITPGKALSIVFSSGTRRFAAYEASKSVHRLYNIHSAVKVAWSMHWLVGWHSCSVGGDLSCWSGIHQSIQCNLNDIVCNPSALVALCSLCVSSFFCWNFCIQGALLHGENTSFRATSEIKSSIHQTSKSSYFPNLFFRT